MFEASNASDLAHGMLSEALPKRWAHVQGVARAAERCEARLGGHGALVVAAWLHDIGYAPAVRDTGERKHSRYYWW